MKFFILLLVFIFCFETPSFAQFTNARNLSFAGAGSMSSSSVDSAFTQNPATLSMEANLEMGGGYSRGDFAPNLDQRTYYGWMKDSIFSSYSNRENDEIKNSLDGVEGFPLSAAFAFQDQKTDAFKYKMYQLSLSKVRYKKFIFGVSARYFDGKYLLAGRRSFHNFSGDLGLVYRKSKSLSFGLSWKNFYKKEEERLTPIVEALRLGVSIRAHKLIKLYLDVENSLEDVEDEFSYGAAFEARMRRFFAFRLGAFQKGPEDSIDLGAGISFLGPKLKVHYGFRKDLETKAALHSVDFSLPLW